MQDLGYDENDDDARENLSDYQAQARQLLIETTRKNLETNLTKAELVNRDVFIVSGNIIYSLVTKNKKSSLAIDEERLIQTVLTVAHNRRYGSQAPVKNHSAIVKDNMVTGLRVSA